MIVTNGVELARFAEKHGWLPIEKSGEDDLKPKINKNNYVCYLTPQGREVIVRFWEDGKIREIMTG